MGKHFKRFFKRPVLYKILFSSFIFSSCLSPLFAQSTSSSGGMTSMVSLLVVATLILVGFLILIFSDKMIKISAEEAGLEEHSKEVGLLPSREEIRPTLSHKYAGNYPVIKLKQGLDIKIKGKPEKLLVNNIESPTFSIKPIDYHGLQPIPKLAVEIGKEVKAGDHIFYDKNYPDIFFSAPVSGEVTEIRRGDKRAVQEIVILADKDIKYREFPKENPDDLSRDVIIERLKDSGCWVSLIERPFGILADANQIPKAIFISTFDTSPLAPDMNFIMQDREQDFLTGIAALQKLTDGYIHLGLNSKKRPLDYYLKAKVKHHWFKGKHPAGNVGVQIHHIDPINKGECVWTIDPVDVATIGRLFREGRYAPERIIAIAGSSITSPYYVKTWLGANVKPLLKDRIEADGKVRVISGNVLTGSKIDADNGHIGASDHLVSVIEEGDFYEFMGWLLPSYPRPSKSITFPWTLFPFNEFEVNTNTHGEKRAFVVTGEYEEVLPMKLYPVHLLKAILANDFEQMEGLGIYEVIEEDLALCEFVCTSKQPVQKILREGINYMIEQS